MKVMESEKLKKYLKLVEKQKKLWDTKVTVIRVVGTHGTVPKNLENRQGELKIKGKIEATQTTKRLK